MDLRQVRSFAAVVEEGSFSKAAIRENATQPGLSTQIARLEEVLSLKLLERHPRGVRPTAAGKRFYAYCISVLGTIHRAQQEMQRFGGTVSGSIRIGLPPTLCKGVISDVIPAFLLAYPNVQVFLSEGYSSSLSDWVAAKRIDVAVVVQPPEQSGLQAKRIYRDRLILASSPTQGIPPGPIRLEDLADIAVILPSPEASFAGKLIHDWLRATNVAPAQVLEIDGMSSVIELIRNSNWAAVLPSVALARELRQGTIQINPFADCSVDLEYFVMHRASLPLSTASQAFVDLLERHLLHMQKEIAANKWRRRKPGRRQSLSG